MNGTVLASVSLAGLAAECIAEARTADAGRSSRMLFGGFGRFRQVLVAFVEGGGLPEHGGSSAVTLQVVSGRVRVSTAGGGWEGSAGDFLVIPAERHDLLALEEAAILLTIGTD